MALTCVRRAGDCTSSCVTSLPAEMSGDSKRRRLHRCVDICNVLLVHMYCTCTCTCTCTCIYTCTCEWWPGIHVQYMYSVDAGWWPYVVAVCGGWWVVAGARGW